MSMNMGAELWRQGAGDLAAAIREKRVSSREVVQAHLNRIDAVNPTINAVVRVLKDEALRAADDADRRISSGERVGLLHGVPITVKENVDLAGTPTTSGVPTFGEALPAVDAPHIAHLRRAGAIPIGRTNLPDLALRWHTHSSLYGHTRNPWNASLTPGGSSGGEGAAVATGMTPLGVGNDLGGSLRWPAQCNGVCALRPTLGRVPQASSINPPDGPISNQLMGVQGPMARRVADLRLALQVMSRPSPRDPWYVPLPVESTSPAESIKVAMVVNLFSIRTSERVAEGVKRAGESLARAGYVVEEVEPPEVVRAADTWLKIMGAELRNEWPVITPVVGDEVKRFVGGLLSLRPVVELTDYIQAFKTRQALGRAWGEFQETYPLVLAPISTEPPFQVGVDLTMPGLQAISNAMVMALAVNVLGLPAVAVPVGVADGLPHAVQVIGPRFREDLCLDAAQAIETARGVRTPIDPR